MPESQEFPQYTNSIPLFLRSGNGYVETRHTGHNLRVPMGLKKPVPNQEVPPGYTFWSCDIVLADGAAEPVFYAIHETHKLGADPEAVAQLAGATIEAFKWALDVPAFADGVPSNEERAIEVGNMMSFMLFRGLSEEQLRLCYNTAYRELKNDN